MGPLGAPIKARPQSGATLQTTVAIAGCSSLRQLVGLIGALQPAEVVVVFRTREPASLARCLARVATLWCRAIRLSGVVA